MSFHILLNRLFYVPSSTFKHFIDERLSAITDPYSTVDLIVSGWFEYDISKIDAAIDILKTYNFKSIVLVVDEWQRQSYIRDDIPVIFVNLFSLLGNDVAVTHTISSPKGLLLTGKLNKIHRIGLLKTLWDKNLLDPNNLLWSFPEHDIQKSSLLSYIDNNNNFDDFYAYCIAHKINNNQNYLRMSEDPPKFVPKDFTDLIDCYQSTNYSIISETYFSEAVQGVTEKTYRAINCKHPFIMAGPVGVLRYLRELGFKTFEEYLPVTDYDKILDPSMRLNAIVENIQAFPQILNQHRSKIDDDVNHNFLQLAKINAYSMEILEDLYTKLDRPVTLISKDFQIRVTSDFDNITEYNQFFAKYTNIDKDCQLAHTYNIVKGVEWPDVSNRKEFELLPDWIKQEFISIVGDVDFL